MVFDLHVHTTKGASDSGLSPIQLVTEAKRIGLDGVCVTEHGRTWERYEFERFRSQHDLVLIRGMEVETDLGHIVVFGLERYVPGIHRAEELRRVIEEAGGFMIAVHPFRRFFDQTNLNRREQMIHPLMVEKASSLPLFDLVDEIEVANGASTEPENLLARKVAKRLGLRGTGGSDAHSTNGLGCFTTVFEQDIESELDLIRELKAGRFYPAQGLLQGHLIPCGEG